MCRGSRKLFKPVIPAIINPCMDDRVMYQVTTKARGERTFLWQFWMAVDFYEENPQLTTKYWFTTVRVKDWDCHNTTTKITRWWMLFISVFIHFHFIFIISINFFQLLRKNCIIYLSNLKDYQNIKYTLKQIIYISIL